MDNGYCIKPSFDPVIALSTSGGQDVFVKNFNPADTDEVTSNCTSEYNGFVYTEGFAFTFLIH